MRLSMLQKAVVQVYDVVMSVYDVAQLEQNANNECKVCCGCGVQGVCQRLERVRYQKVQTKFKPIDRWS